MGAPNNGTPGRMDASTGTHGEMIRKQRLHESDLVDTAELKAAQEIGKERDLAGKTKAAAQLEQWRRDNFEFLTVQENDKAVGLVKNIRRRRQA